MSIDRRTRRRRDAREIPRDEVFDSLLPEAAERHGALAGRGIAYAGLPSLGIECGDRGLTLAAADGGVALVAGTGRAGVVAVLAESALSDLVQDRASTMGLAMNAAVEVTRGGLSAWIAWEPALRALLDGRPVHERGAVVPRGRDGAPLDLGRRFRLDDDRAEISHFLHEAGFLHIDGVFDPAEMDAVSADLDAALARAAPDDGASWWARDSKGVDQAVRVLFFHEQSAALRELLADARLTWLGALTGDDHDASALGAEGLVKPLDIVSGLSDLPWHKDCGQGGHSYMCNGMTVGISVTGADRSSGALGVVPGSHRANVQTARLDPNLDLEPILLETRTGDVTVHCSDTLHMSHRPVERPRKVVYTGIRLRPLAGDVAPKLPRQQERAARARLSDVQGRIQAADRSG